MEESVQAEYAQLLPDPVVTAENVHNYNSFVNIHSSAAFLVVISYLLTLFGVNIYILVHFDQDFSEYGVISSIVLSGCGIVGLLGMWYTVRRNTRFSLISCISLPLTQIPLITAGYYLVTLILDYPTSLTCTFMQHFTTVVFLNTFAPVGYLLWGVKENVPSFTSCPEYNIKRFSWIFLNMLICTSNIENCITLVLSDGYITEDESGYIVLFAVSIVASILTILAIVFSNAQRRHSHLYNYSTNIQIICNLMMAVLYISYVINKLNSGEDYNFYFMFLMHIVLSCLYVVVYLMSVLMRTAPEIQHE